jgi:ADP-heptose:LPS heptosyltransferase
VVIDSFPSHLAGALGTPVVVLYGPAPARVTQPRGDKERIINLEPNMLDVCNILSHCWSTPPSGKKKCTSPCINTISPLKIINAVKKLLDK